MWKPIETAPRDGAVIDLFGTRNGKPQRFTDAKWGQDCFGGQALEIWSWHHADRDVYGEFDYSHWMPTPDAPEMICGMVVVVDPDIPDGEIHIRDDEQLLGKIINVR